VTSVECSSAASTVDVATTRQRAAVPTVVESAVPTMLSSSWLS
jgi:hypothetical protein